MYILIQPASHTFLYIIVTTFNRFWGVDFEDEHYIVNFPDQAEEASFTVTIFDDDIAECPEEFFLELRIPENAYNMGVIKGNLSNATVVINDADCEY